MLTTERMDARQPKPAEICNIIVLAYPPISDKYFIHITTYISMFNVAILDTIESVLTTSPEDEKRQSRITASNLKSEIFVL